MRITKVSVKKLLGVFDHEIPLNQDSRITVMHGPNGFGKTILLTMLYGIFNASYRVFYGVPFEEFRVYFDHQGYIVVEKDDDDALRLSFMDVTGNYTVNLHEDTANDVAWLSDIRRSVNVVLIKTQRLQTDAALEHDSLRTNTSDSARIRGLAVEEFSVKAAKYVHNIHGERILTESQLKALEGLIESCRNLVVRHREFEDPDEEIQEKLIDVESMLETIQRREPSVQEKDKRLAMLVELLNGHFSFKTVFTDAKSGLVILSHEGRLIPVISLSSGEQHQLVLFSKLLFDIPPNSLVLIDEPELSLHVTWQHEFLNDLKRIIDLCDFDVLLATHSPQIVHDKWDWMVDLHNPEADYSDNVAEYA